MLQFFAVKVVVVVVEIVVLIVVVVVVVVVVYVLLVLQFLKGDHPRIISLMFGCNLSSSFKRSLI